MEEGPRPQDPSASLVIREVLVVTEKGISRVVPTGDVGPAAACQDRYVGRSGFDLVSGRACQLCKGEES